MNNLMRRSGIIAVLCLVLCALLLVTACGDKTGDETTPSETTKAPDVTTAGDVTTEEVTTEEVTTEEVTTEEVTTPGDVTTEVPKTTYTVVVKDQDGNAVAGVSVQLCEGDRCLTPVTTDATGTATFTVEAATYQASILSVPAGYKADTATKYDFAAGATSVNVAVEKEAQAPSVDVPTGTTTITESVGSLATPVEQELKGEVSFLYEALTDGEIKIQLVAGAKASITISNVTSGKAGTTIEGLGAVAVGTKAGNTYLVSIKSIETENVKYYVSVSDSGNGTEANPFVLDMGMVERTFTIKAGETLYCLVNDPYFYIATPNVSVLLNGVTYGANNNGDIYGSEIGLEEGDVVGLVAGETDVTVTVNLTGSDIEHPLDAFHLGYYELSLPASAVAYIQASDEAINAIVSDDFVGNVTIANVNGTEAPFAITRMMRMPIFTVKNNSNSRLVNAGFQIVPLIDGLDLSTAIDLDTDYVEASLYEQKVAASVNMMGVAELYYTYTADKYGIVKADGEGFFLAVNGEYCDLTPVSEGILVEKGDVVTFVLQFDLTDDAFVSVYTDYVTVNAVIGENAVTVPAGASVKVAPGFMLLMNGCYLESVTGTVSLSSFGTAVEAPMVFSMRGASDVLLTNSTEEEVEAVVVIAAAPNGGMSNPVELEAEGTQVVDVITQTVYANYNNHEVWFTYTAAEAGTFKVTATGTSFVGGALYMVIPAGAEENYSEWVYPDLDDSDVTAGIEVAEGDTLVFYIVSNAAVEYSFTYGVTE